MSWIAALVAVVALPAALVGQDEGISRGAGEESPSLAYYFDWINSQYEGSTEVQSLVNLEFFRWLHDEYGMALDIYALDVGNIDDGPYTAGVGRVIPNHYGSLESEEFRRQFPRGFAPLVERAAAFGCRLGIWLGPDGFGETPDDERARTEMLVSLCRDYNFRLFKFDAVAGGLRAEKQDALVRALIACRRICPDLIALNERVDLGKAEPYFTTELWEGAETYIDVFSANAQTALHHRAGALSRPCTPGLKRLIEDHGVCLSSCLDHWEDDLVLQAFNRSSILAPEIYGSPWLLRDEEFPRLARLCNLHRRYRAILVRGMALPEQRYGPHAVSRGDGATRLLTLRNLTWMPARYELRLDESIGLAPCERVELRRLHPAERILGRYPHGASVAVEVAPFRSCLILATAAPCGELGVEGCDYEIRRDVPARPVEIALLGPPGGETTIEIAATRAPIARAFLDGEEVPRLARGEPVRIRFPGRAPKRAWHRHLGTLVPCPVPSDAEGLYEASCFAADADALEVRSLRRSGPSAIPQVVAARRAFFDQPMFVRRGIWDRNLFDGDEETFFFARREGGALRLDLGTVVELDRLVLRTMSRYDRDLAPELHRFSADALLEYSSDLLHWRSLNPGWSGVGTIALARFDAGTRLRYLRLQGVPRCIAEIEAYRGREPLERSRWRASNLLAAYANKRARAAWSLRFELDELAAGSYLAVALEGEHGDEGAIAALRVGERLVGAPDRAVSYPSNTWEYQNVESKSNYTYFIPLEPWMVGKPMEVVVLGLDGGVARFCPELYLSAYPVPLVARQLVLHRAR